MISKQKVAANFSRHAKTYDEHAELQRGLYQQLMDFVPQTFVPESICDFGCGTGFGLTLLYERFPDTQIIGLDIADGMLQTARSRVGRQHRVNLVQADIEQAPFADNSLHMLVANASLQWCKQPDTFQSLFRLLKPGGVLLVSTFTHGTFHQLHKAYKTISMPSAVHAQPTAASWVKHFVINFKFY